MTARRLLILAAATLMSCAPHQALPVLGAVPDFELTDQSGGMFKGSTLRGHVWVADFIYTNCPGPCPLMSQRMKRILTATAAIPDVQLVSFSVDPARDTPRALREYAKRFGASAGRWTFLTGDAKTLEHLDRDAFKLGDLDAALNHSTRFVLVDEKGRIRAYYTMGQEKMVERIAGDAARLRGENS